MAEWTTTQDLKVPEKFIEQVIGQEFAVEIVKKAALQRRHVLLIGDPGTGKSMLGVALSQLLPKENLVDVLVFPNGKDENQPLIRVAPAGSSHTIVGKAKLAGQSIFRGQNVMLFVLLLAAISSPWIAKSYLGYSDVLVAAMIIGSFFMIPAIIIGANLLKRMGVKARFEVPKILIDNSGKKEAPFWDATGAHAGALLGDVLHDPLQSGGFGTPAHERVVPGMIHKANMGVLFIDEIATLAAGTQQQLLTALQEGKFPITGQSDRSSGAMVHTEAVPCNFILVAAGNVEALQHMHPALRSRIKGYGYEVFMKDTMPDNADNRLKIAYFVAQEVIKDKKIPHFSRDAVDLIINEARQYANRKNHLTLRLRELGGLIRAAGDVAVQLKSKIVLPEHIITAKNIAKSLEQQMADKYIERKKEYDVIVTTGTRIGRVNGLAVMGTGLSHSGIVLPIEAEVSPGDKQKEIIATGKLGVIAKEAITNVTALINKKYSKNLKNTDIYVQFLQTYEGVEGDSASIAVSIAVISAITNKPVRQDLAMTGSLSVRGDVLPIGGVNAKIHAAIDAGIKCVIVPRSNMQDIVLPKKDLAKITVIPVDKIDEVIKYALSK